MILDSNYTMNLTLHLVLQKKFKKNDKMRCLHQTFREMNMNEYILRIYI